MLQIKKKYINIHVNTAQAHCAFNEVSLFRHVFNHFQTISFKISQVYDGTKVPILKC